MIPVHSMILWAKPREEPFEETVNKTYSILNILKEFGPELSPNFLPAYSKKNVKPFDGSIVTLEELIKKGINKEGKTVFPDLGYTVDFFSSLDDMDAAKISFHVGTTHKRMSNVLVVDFPASFPMYSDNQLNEKIIDLFKKCIAVFDPYWGCISNSLNTRRYNFKLWENDQPKTIHWVNYFGDDMPRKVEERLIKTAPVYKAERYHDGYLIILKKTPIDDENQEDIEIQNKAKDHFGL